MFGSDGYRPLILVSCLFAGRTPDHVAFTLGRPIFYRNMDQHHESFVYVFGHSGNMRFGLYLFQPGKPAPPLPRGDRSRATESGAGPGLRVVMCRPAGTSAGLASGRGSLGVEDLFRPLTRPMLKLA
jgi:hypothetical protein